MLCHTTDSQKGTLGGDVEGFFFEYSRDNKNLFRM